VLFTLINEYPIANDRDMTEEMGISITTLRYIAKVLRLVKSPEARREAKERLKRHGIDMIERRGGDQTKDKKKKPNKQKSKK
jgi:6-phosphofructokinase